MSTVEADLSLVNELSKSRSPYVRGHSNNPVAWQMWSPATLNLAKKHNRLLFVSIGYAACHWCHVMERESFLSSEVAQLLNDNFIPIKIDREERPDIDAIYMNYVQATTGSGGWPLNVFLTPDLQPVFGGTYWPGPDGGPSSLGKGEVITFVEILEKMRDVWKNQEDKCRSSAQEITRQLKEFAEEGVHSHKLGEKGTPEDIDIDLLEEAYQHFSRKFDPLNAGFSGAPKFPTPVNLSFLLRLGQWPQAVADIVGTDECADAASMAIATLRKMARGGIRDQIGYGFSRYSVTPDWSLPHWEKMLYDQAQLLDAYLDAFVITHDPEMLGAALDIATYLTSPPIASPDGGFFCAEDADSLPSPSDTEKREGAYYLWTLKELRTALGDDARAAAVCARFYGVSADGNIAPDHDPHDELLGQNALSVQSTPHALSQALGMADEEVVAILKDGRKKLRAYREAHRPRPSLDDKIIVSWNGLAIGALARASVVLEAVDPERAAACREAAEKAVGFIKRELYDEESERLWRICREGRGETQGFVDDYAYLIRGLIDLYEATFDDAYLQFAERLQETQNTAFLSPTGAFYTTPHPASSFTSATTSPTPSSLPTQQPDLLLRLTPGMDSSEPSPNAIAASNLLRLSSLLSHAPYHTLAQHVISAFEAEIQQWPFCFVGLLQAGVSASLGVKGVVLVGREDGRREGEGGKKDEGGKEDGDEEGIEEGEAFRAEGGWEEVLRRARNGVGVGRTMAFVGGGKGRWLRERREELRKLDMEKDRILVCEGTACREGVEFL